MSKPSHLDDYYGLLFSHPDMPLADIRRNKNRLLLEINHPDSPLDWSIMDQKTQSLQHAFRQICSVHQD